MKRKYSRNGKCIVTPCFPPESAVGKTIAQLFRFVYRILAIFPGKIAFLKKKLLKKSKKTGFEGSRIRGVKETQHEILRLSFP